MSLEFNLSKVKDYKTACYQEDGGMIPETKSLVFMTIAVGIPEITAKNHETFLRRLNTWEKAHDAPLTPAAVVKAHVGLKTNASRYTEKKFVSRVKEALYRELVAGLHEATATKTYSVIRRYKGDHKSKVVETGLTRQEAEEHCNDPETSSRTATSKEAAEHTAKYGEWFDSFIED